MLGLDFWWSIARWLPDWLFLAIDWYFDRLWWIVGLSDFVCLFKFNYIIEIMFRLHFKDWTIVFALVIFFIIIITYWRIEYLGWLNDCVLAGWVTCRLRCGPSYPRTPSWSASHSTQTWTLWRWCTPLSLVGFYSYNSRTWWATWLMKNITSDICWSNTVHTDRFCL